MGKKYNKSLLRITFEILSFIFKISLAIFILTILWSEIFSYTGTTLSIIFLSALFSIILGIGIIAIKADLIIYKQ